ncbi:hypothetical protein EGI22_14295 [Lacihabitans sp. LS3-19]|uniref:hypothetical protein n=1 Tax=Lacihabitans sp. LS3-19 TaxID=2487335 RepID=UPI0020CE2285|nr:hypothetical protein [Lacihabitans sp. LS3-19]MCP9769085.1 hypothetical protein [Lacihabitans sp. LS3-19]
MKNNHLTDETLQAFLLKETQADTVALHLSECKECTTKLEYYHNLIVDITKVAPESFPFEITTIVMDKIMLYEQKKSNKQEFIFWLLLTFILVGISSLSIPFIPKILTVFYSKSIFTTLLIIGTGLIVLLFLFADIYQQYKTKEEKIFKNNLQPIL